MGIVNPACRIGLMFDYAWCSTELSSLLLLIATDGLTLFTFRFTNFYITFTNIWETRLYLSWRQKQAQITSMVSRVCGLSLFLHALYFRWRLYPDLLYNVGKLSSYVWLDLLLMELAKGLYVVYKFGLDTDVRPHRFTPPAGRLSLIPIIRRVRWKEGLGYAKLFILSVVFYGFICFVLGAPLQQWEETVCLALTLTTLTICPIMLFIGQAQTYQLLLSKNLEPRCDRASSYLQLLKNNCIGVILGAWSASVVAPLDWDRPWQVYPIPNIVGSIVGLFAMNVFNLCTAWIRLYRCEGLKI